MNKNTIITIAIISGAIWQAPLSHGDDIATRPETLTFPPLSFTPPNAAEFRQTLADGTPVYMAPSHEFPLVKFSITAVGGANMVPEGKAGLAGITMSMLRSGGTSEMSPADVDETLDLMATNCGFKGGKFFCTGSIDCLSANWDPSLKLFMDMIRSPRFDEARLKLDLDETLEGLKQRNDNADSILEREWRFAMYGENHFESIQPTAEGIASITADDLRKFSQSIFHPGNFVITVSGDFEPKAMMASLESAFGGWVSGPRNPGPTAPTHTLKPGIYHAEKDIPQGKVYLGMRSIQRDDPDFIPLMVMNDILGGGGFSSRIMTSVRSNEGLAYSANSSLQPGLFYPGEFRAGFQSKNATVALAIDLILNEFNKIRTEPVTAAELDVAKRSFIETFPRTFESKAAMLGVFVNDELTNRPAGYWHTYRDKVDAVTAADIARVANKYITPDNMMILVVGKWSDIGPGNDRADMSDFAKPFGEVIHLPARDPLTLKPVS